MSTPHRCMPTSISTRPSQRHARLDGGPRCRIDLRMRIEAQADRGFVRERCEPAQLACAHDLVAHQHVAHASAHERLGLADLLAALADGTRGDLQQRDVGALVRLGVGPQPDARRARERGHVPQVVLERVEVDDQCGRVDVVDRRADRNVRVLHRGDPSLANVPCPK